mmetsp:Transcript_150536/g.288493  ORF Transcript_150536/g.288493 Transcript_150536/m.288493 type:complete len:85 (+) Transcript_150536:95-349(+)
MRQQPVENRKIYQERCMLPHGIRGVHCLTCVGSAGKSNLKVDTTVQNALNSEARQRRQTPIIDWPRLNCGRFDLQLCLTLCLVS